METLSHWPYDSRDPQDQVLSTGFDWQDPSIAVGFWGFVHATAKPEEVEWSTDPDDRKSIFPVPLVVVWLTAEAAMGSGLTQQWGPK